MKLDKSLIEYIIAEGHTAQHNNVRRLSYETLSRRVIKTASDVMEVFEPKRPIEIALAANFHSHFRDFFMP